MKLQTGIFAASSVSTYKPPAKRGGEARPRGTNVVPRLFPRAYGVKGRDDAEGYERWARDVILRHVPHAKQAPEPTEFAEGAESWTEAWEQIRVGECDKNRPLLREWRCLVAKEAREAAKKDGEAESESESETDREEHYEPGDDHVHAGVPFGADIGGAQEPEHVPLPEADWKDGWDSRSGDLRGIAQNFVWEAKKRAAAGEHAEQAGENHEDAQNTADPKKLKGNQKRLYKKLISALRRAKFADQIIATT